MTDMGEALLQHGFYEILFFSFVALDGITHLCFGSFHYFLFYFKKTLDFLFYCVIIGAVLIGVLYLFTHLQTVRTKERCVPKKNIYFSGGIPT